MPDVTDADRQLNSLSIKITYDLLSGIGTISISYIYIDVGGTKMHSLVDTGSSRSYIWSVGLNILGSGGYKIDRSRAGAVMMANGTIEAVIGQACLPFTFSETTHSVDFKIIPGLSNTCVLGMDFVEKFGIVLHLRDKQLWLADEPITKICI